MDASLDRADGLPRFPLFLESRQHWKASMPTQCSPQFHQPIARRSYDHFSQCAMFSKHASPGRNDGKGYASAEHPTKSNGKGNGKGKLGRLHSVSAMVRSTIPTNREAVRSPEIVSVSLKNICLSVAFSSPEHEHIFAIAQPFASQSGTRKAPSWEQSASGPLSHCSLAQQVSQLAF